MLWSVPRCYSELIAQEIRCLYSQVSQTSSLKSFRDQTRRRLQDRKALLIVASKSREPFLYLSLHLKVDYSWPILKNEMMAAKTNLRFQLKIKKTTSRLHQAIKTNRRRQREPAPRSKLQICTFQGLEAWVELHSNKSLARASYQTVKAKSKYLILLKIKIASRTLKRNNSQTMEKTKTCKRTFQNTRSNHWQKRELVLQSKRPIYIYQCSEVWIGQRTSLLPVKVSWQKARDNLPMDFTPRCPTGFPKSSENEARYLNGTFLTHLHIL